MSIELTKDAIEADCALIVDYGVPLSEEQIAWLNDRVMMFGNAFISIRRGARG